MHIAQNLSISRPLINPEAIFACKYRKIPESPKRGKEKPTPHSAII
jgi:hypothetical protein